MTLLTISKEQGIKYINNVRSYNLCDGELTVITGYGKATNYIVLPYNYTSVKVVGYERGI